MFRSRDYYHTCYCLSGLSIAEHFIVDDVKESEEIVGGKKNVLVSIKKTSWNIWWEKVE